MEDCLQKLYPYQITHVQALNSSLQNQECILDSSDTGTGKTYTTSALCKLNNLHAFVVCPKTVIESWYNTMKIFDTHVLAISNYESIRCGNYYENVNDFYNNKRKPCPYVKCIENTEDKTVHFHWDLPPNTLIIFDEAHKGKNLATLNSQLFLSMKKVISKNCPKLIILSATISDDIERFRNTSYLLGLSQIGKHAYKIWLKTVYLKYPGLDMNEIVQKILYPKYGSRMRISDLKTTNNLEIFKENYISTVPQDMSPIVEKEIENAYNDIEDALMKVRAKQITEGSYLTILLRCRQRMELLKVPTAVLIAMENLLNENSVVIFINFSETKKMLLSHLEEFVKLECECHITFIDGDQTTVERRQQIDDFQKDRSRLIIVNIKAGGVGVSLHDVNGRYPRYAIHFPTWSSIDFKQCLGRIHRAGSKSAANQIILYCKGNISNAINQDKKDSKGVEELIAYNVNKKLKNIEWLNNGDDINDLVQI